MSPLTRAAVTLGLLPFLALPVLADAKPDPKAGPTPQQVRRAVEQSLAFLEKDGVAWMESKHCASCHAVPMTIWSLHEADKAGFAVNRKALDDLRGRALKEYVDHPKFKPVGQDGTGDGLSRNTIYLSLAAGAATAPDAETAKALDKFAAHLLATQQADGSWKLGGSQPPVADTDDVTTMWALLALAGREQTGPAKEAWPKGRDRALAWLKETKPTEGNQPLVLRVLVARRFGKAEEAEPLVKQLLGQQNADGGWSQVKGRAGDALATGQALYALAAAGKTAEDPAVRRAHTYLVAGQQKDGSWPVPTRVKNGHDVIISYTGTGWAALGLMRTLSAGTKACLVHYSGKVQGVGFRATAAAIATDYPVTGWVKNLPDGRVQLLAEGPEEAVEKFLKAVRTRWKDNIEKEQVEKQAPAGKLKGFEIVR